MIIYIICESVDFHPISISGISYVHKQEVFKIKIKTESIKTEKYCSTLFFFLQNIEVIAVLHCVSHYYIASRCHCDPVFKDKMIYVDFNLLFAHYNKSRVFQVILD